MNNILQSRLQNCAFLHNSAAFEAFIKNDHYLRLTKGRKWMHKHGIPCPPRPEYDYIDEHGTVREKYYEV